MNTQEQFSKTYYVGDETLIIAQKGAGYEVTCKDRLTGDEVFTQRNPGKIDEAEADKEALYYAQVTDKSICTITETVDSFRNEKKFFISELDTLMDYYVDADVTLNQDFGDGNSEYEATVSFRILGKLFFKPKKIGRIYPTGKLTETLVEDIVSLLQKNNADKDAVALHEY